LKSPALIVLGAGIVSALHTGKVPAALSLIQAEFGMSLVLAGVLISMLQMSSACIGLFGGALVDRMGHARCMFAGLVLLGLGSILGAMATSASLLLASRVLESIGLVLTVLPGPSLMRQSVPEKGLMAWLGWWSAYMPLGMGLGLLLVPLALSWRFAWIAISLISFAWAFWVARTFLKKDSVTSHPADLGRESLDAGSIGKALAPQSLLDNARSTVTSWGPWLLALGFCFYAAQFMGVFGFLPTIYKEAGVSAGWSGVLTSVGVLANAWGNVRGGQLAQAGRAIDRTIIESALVMILTAWLIFAAPLNTWIALLFDESIADRSGFWLRYVAVVLFSAWAGRIPASFFNLSNRFAPKPEVVATTVGFMQQGGAVGQLAGPVLIAWVVTQTGTWAFTWWVTGLFSAILMGFAVGIGREIRRRKESQANAAL
jgi:MFS transporter, CP family, cyanate transporter